MRQVKIYPNSQALTDAAVQYFIQLGKRSIRERGRFSIALSGGSTPKGLYQSLCSPSNRSRLDWTAVHFFWGDERHVPPDHPGSNYRMVKEALLDCLTIPLGNVHRVLAEMSPEGAAFDYEEELREFFPDDWPRFDLILLGMGGDGHTASLFPQSEGLHEERRWFIANFAPKIGQWRLTLTKNAINAARNILVMVSGESKAGMLAKVLTGPEDSLEKPIKLISPTRGEMLWMVDEAAAVQLTQTGSYICSF